MRARGSRPRGRPPRPPPRPPYRAPPARAAGLSCPSLHLGLELFDPLHQAAAVGARAVVERVPGVEHGIDVRLGEHLRLLGRRRDVDLHAVLLEALDRLAVEGVVAGEMLVLDLAQLGLHDRLEVVGQLGPAALIDHERPRHDGADLPQPDMLGDGVEAEAVGGADRGHDQIDDAALQRRHDLAERHRGRRRAELAHQGRGLGVVDAHLLAGEIGHGVDRPARDDALLLEHAGRELHGVVFGLPDLGHLGAQQRVEHLLVHRDVGQQPGQMPEVHVRRLGAEPRRHRERAVEPAVTHRRRLLGAGDQGVVELEFEATFGRGLDTRRHALERLDVAAAHRVDEARGPGDLLRGGGAGNQQAGERDDGSERGEAHGASLILSGQKDHTARFRLSSNPRSQRARDMSEFHQEGAAGLATAELTAPGRLVVSLATLFAWLAAAGILFMATATVYDVFVRYVLNSPTTWATETSTYALIATVFFGAAYTHLADGNVRIKVGMDRLS